MRCSLTYESNLRRPAPLPAADGASNGWFERARPSLGDKTCQQYDDNRADCGGHYLVDERIGKGEADTQGIEQYAPHECSDEPRDQKDQNPAPSAQDEEGEKSGHDADHGHHDQGLRVQILHDVSPCAGVKRHSKRLDCQLNRMAASRRFSRSAAKAVWHHLVPPSGG